MRSGLTFACLVPLFAMLAGCASGGRYDAPGVGRFVPAGDRALLRFLGDYPSPGQSASSEIRDAKGNVVPYPTGLDSFADAVVDYRIGSPAPLPEGQDPKTALGPPDYTTNTWERPHAVSLGNGGALTLRFEKRPIVDIDGPDLFIFEIGPSVEAMLVDVSRDGKNWTSVGEALGGACSVDIGPYVAPGDAFEFVRLRDIAYQGAESDSWPGADIDAVGALGAAERMELPSEVLFAFDSDTLAEGAARELDRVVVAIERRRSAKITVDGHTDDVGTAEYNQRLSERRAEAVAEYLFKRGVPKGSITARGHGERRRLAEGESDETRRKNRRVEILIQDR